MHDVSPLSPGRGQGRPDRAAAGAGHRTAEAASISAGASAAREDGETRRSLARLQQALAAGTPLRRDAPRGSYLDIVV